jgi:hypothetical protein
MNRDLKQVTYNIHGKVAIHISTINQDILDFYNRFFRQFNDEEKTGILTYSIRDYSCFELPQRFFYVNTEQIGFDHGFCLPDERYAVVIHEDGISEYTDAEAKAPNFWLQFILLRQNLCMIHGAGVEIKGRGVIVTSFSGGGKTTLVAHLRKLTGFRFFTDEFVIIDSHGTMFSYPSDLSIFHVHLDLFSELQTPVFRNYFENRKRIIRILTILEKIPTPQFLQKFKKFSLFTLSRFAAGPAYLKIPAADIIAKENIGTETKVDTALFLTRYNGEDITLREIENTLFIDKIVRMLSLEFREKLVYLLFLSVCDSITVASYEQKQKEILSAALSRVKTFEVYVPYSMDPAFFSESIEKILDSMGK